MKTESRATMFAGHLVALTLALSVAAWSGLADAQEGTDQYFDAIAALNWAREPGQYDVPGVNAAVQVEPDEYLLRGEQAHRYMEITEGHGNFKPDAVVVRLDDSQVLYDYVEMGHIKMDDWEAHIDPDELLAVMKEQTRKENVMRAAGHSNLYVDGWAEQPRIDRRNAVVYWAIRAHTSDGVSLINAKALKLGRKGFTSVTWIGASQAFKSAQFNLRPALAAYSFDEGWTYADYKPGVDTAAAVGVGALAYRMMTGERAGNIGGKAGAGIAAAIVAFFKKAWLLLLLPFYFVWVGLKRLFGGGGGPR